MAKTGLVMEGGAMRGLFTAGVLDVLMENGIDFDGAVGVSAGATFGCNIKSRQIGRVLRYNTRFCGSDRYGSLKSWLRTGDAYEVQFCYHAIPEQLDPFDTETFTNNPMEFYVVATNLETGKPEYHKCTDGKRHDLEWIRASASIPILSRTVNLEGKQLVDGGLSDAVPLRFFQSIGYEKNLVILTRPDHYRKQKNQATPLCRLIYRKYPKFVDCFAQRHIAYNQNIAYIRSQEQSGSTFVIRPAAALPLSSMEKDPEKLKAAYMLGRQAADEAIQKRELKQWLSEARKAAL